MRSSGYIQPSAALADSVFRCGFLLHLQSADARQAICYSKAAAEATIAFNHDATALATFAVPVQVKATKHLSCGCHTGQDHDCSKVKHHSVL